MIDIEKNHQTLQARIRSSLALAHRGDSEYACGPEPMLRSTAKLARSYGISCQISLEEFMACATGGCAGCAVKVSLPEGKIMQRVCVDGPVFDAQMIYPDD